MSPQQTELLRSLRQGLREVKTAAGGSAGLTGARPERGRPRLPPALGPQAHQPRRASEAIRHHRLQRCRLHVHSVQIRSQLRQDFPSLCLSLSLCPNTEVACSLSARRRARSTLPCLGSIKPVCVASDILLIWICFGPVSMITLHLCLLCRWPLLQLHRQDLYVCVCVYVCVRPCVCVCVRARARVCIWGHQRDAQTEIQPLNRHSRQAAQTLAAPLRPSPRPCRLPPPRIVLPARQSPPALRRCRSHHCPTHLQPRFKCV